MEGILDVTVNKGTTNGDTFYDFVSKILLPNLLPYNGVNHHSVVVMDNCTIHHIPEIAPMIEGVGALVHFLPPYSPDINPIEGGIFKSKQLLVPILVHNGIP